MAEQTEVGRIQPRVLVFFDYSCQFCYLDWPRLRRLRVDHGAELFLVPFELHPQLPVEGLSVEEIGEHSPHVREHMERMATEYSLPLIHPRRIPNTHLALSLGECARDLGPAVHERVHEAIFEAYSGRGEDVGDREVLLAIARSQGLDDGDVAAALDEGRYEERLHQFHHLALAMGITATPAALVCNELLIGSRPYRVLEESLERCLVTAESLAQAEREKSSADEGLPPTIDS